MEVLREDTEVARDFVELYKEKRIEMLRLRDASEDTVMEELYVCDECGDVFGLEDDLKTHVKKFHEEYDSCLFCPFRGSKMDCIAHL
jgi:uncharacterized C2H2 Zn-finger protein